MRVDHGTCSGTAHCRQFVPQVFTLIDRKSYVRGDVDWSTVDRAELQHAVDGCPWFAISIEQLNT